MNLDGASPEESLFLDLLRAGHRARMHAGGRSMAPWIWPGSLVEIEPPTHPFNIGDILLARVGGALVLHRLIERRGDGALLLKGDRIAAPDTPLAPSDILGRVVFVQRGLPRHPTRLPGCWLSGVIAASSRVRWKVRRRLRGLRGAFA